MKTVLDVRRQLCDLCERVGVSLGCHGDSENIRRALLVGLFTNVAEHIGEGKYRTVSRSHVLTIIKKEIFGRDSNPGPSDC